MRVCINYWNRHVLQMTYLPIEFILSITESLLITIRQFWNHRRWSARTW